MEPTILYPSRLKWILVSLAGLIFVGIGILMITSGEGAIAWLCTVFFGLVAGVGILQLLPNTSYLKLDENGFEIKTLGRSKIYSWEQISGFTTYRAGRNNFVGFETSTTGKMADINRKIAGADSSLPDTYGMKPDALIALMTQYANAYWAKNSQPNA